MFNFEKLKVYQEAVLLASDMVQVVRLWPKQQEFILTSQLLRAVFSISLNIAEGSSRTKKDFRHFLDVARGSCFESVAILTIAKNVGFISGDQFSSYYGRINTIVRMIHGLKHSLL